MQKLIIFSFILNRWFTRGEIMLLFSTNLFSLTSLTVKEVFRHNFKFRILYNFDYRGPIYKTSVYFLNIFFRKLGVSKLGQITKIRKYRQKMMGKVSSINILYISSPKLFSKNLSFSSSLVETGTKWEIQIPLVGWNRDQYPRNLAHICIDW